MFKFRNKKFHTKLFIAAALIAYIVFIFIYFSFSHKTRYNSNKKTRQDKKDSSLGLYLKENETRDPFITKTPQLGDILAGPIISDFDPSKGSISAPVNMVIFSDFKCGYYAQNKKIIENLILKYKDQIRLIWKDYPADQDKNSITYLAARAGRCAQAQGKFWVFHDMLYNYSLVLQRKIPREVASKTGLDLEKYDICMKAREIDVLIDNNIKEAEALGITGIPFIFVNTQEAMGVIDQETLEKMINIELERVK